MRSLWQAVEESTSPDFESLALGHSRCTKRLKTTEIRNASIAVETSKVFSDKLLGKTAPT